MQVKRIAEYSRVSNEGQKELQNAPIEAFCYTFDLHYVGDNWSLKPISVFLRVTILHRFYCLEVCIRSHWWGGGYIPYQPRHVTRQ